jgi:IS30 family transposase
MGTLVERASRYVMLLHLPGGRSPEMVRDALIAMMQGLPRQLARSVTWDQGTELARHHEFTAATGIPVYFCEPHSPWQRGTNENTNRQRSSWTRGGCEFRAAHTPHRTSSNVTVSRLAPRDGD